MLADELPRLHPVPAVPLTAALGVTRRADAMSLVSFEGGQYSVPHQLAGEAVHVRRHGGHVVIAHIGEAGPAEVARHLATAPGSPRVDDAHYPPAPPGALHREPKARSRAEAQFLAIGDGARLWLGEAAAAGACTIRDRVVQASLKLVLEPVFEADFLPCSYGFRPGRRVHDAVAEVRHLTSHSYEWIVEGDIRACLDAWSHCSFVHCGC
jgi:hypothetical protein